MQMIEGQKQAMCTLLVQEPYLGIAREHQPLQDPQWMQNTLQQDIEL